MPDAEVICRGSDLLLRATSRRRFLALLGAAGTAVLLPGMFAACSDADSLTDPDAPQFRLDLSNDVGILNALYLLEQVEAAFYGAAVASPGYAGLSATEQQTLTVIRAHEVSHRDLLKQTLGDASIPPLAFNDGALASATADRAALLKTAQLLEDTGVSAYTGSGKYLTVAANLLLLDRIGPVEGRHAATIRDMRDASTGLAFAGDDVVDAQGLDVKVEPDTAITEIGALGVVTSALGVRTLASQSKRTTDRPAPTPA